MDREKDIINKFKNFQEDILKILQNTEKERNKWKSQVDGLMISGDVVQERYNEEHAENVKLRETILNLEKKNLNLQEQVNNLLAERQTFIKQLNVLGRKHADRNDEEVPEPRDIANVNKELKLNGESRKSGSSIERREEESQVNDEITSIQEDYSFTTQFTQISPVKNEKLKYDELLNPDSPFMQLADKFIRQDENVSVAKNDENNKKAEVEIIAESSCAKKNEKPPMKWVVPETVETDYGNYIIDSASENEKTPERKIIRNLEKSPDLRDQSSKKRKNSSSTSLEARANETFNKNISMSPIRVIDQKLLLKPKNTSFLGVSSSSKRTKMEDSDIFNTPEKKFKSPNKLNKTTPSKTPVKLKFQGIPKKSPARLQRTPKKSPIRTSQLKKSHLLDVEKTFDGIKKMTQTKLNLDHFTNKKRNEKENQSVGDKILDLKDALRPSYNFMSQSKKDDDDDLIFGSPQIKSKSLTEFKSKPGCSKINSEPSQSLLNDDPEATYVSSLFVKNWKKNEIFDDIPEEIPLTPRVDLSPTEKIPDLNPDPISPPYKRGAVRKKADRMKLPGRVCYQCEDYYRSVYGDNINQKEFQKILDQCSRHRDKHPDPDTPPGFWKPYLTMTPERK